MPRLSILIACLLTVALVLTAAPAHAGAWPREKGTFFVSGNATFSWPKDIDTLVNNAPVSEYFGLFAEYGLTRRLTLGVDLGKSSFGSYKTLVFLRAPLRNRDSGAKIAVELALGQIASHPVVRPGLSVGYGFELGRTTGWLSAEGMAEHAWDVGSTDYKLDLTFGLTFPSGRKVVLQAQSGMPDSANPYVKFAPSVILPVGKTTHAEFGVILGIDGDGTFGLKAGFWQTF